MTKCWKRLSSGKYIDLNNFKIEDVDLGDIELSLNHITRFTGHHKDEKPLTVAEHTYLCYLLAAAAHPDDHVLKMHVLVHDFAEAYIGDVATPVKKAMGDRWYKFAKPIEDTVELAVLGYNLTEEEHDRVKLFDLAALDIERRMMWKSQYGKDKWPDCPLNVGTIKDKNIWFGLATGPIKLEQMVKERLT